MAVWFNKTSEKSHQKSKKFHKGWNHGCWKILCFRVYLAPVHYTLDIFRYLLQANLTTDPDFSVGHPTSFVESKSNQRSTFPCRVVINPIDIHTYIRTYVRTYVRACVRTDGRTDRQTWVVLKSWSTRIHTNPKCIFLRISEDYMCSDNRANNLFWLRVALKLYSCLLYDKISIFVIHATLNLLPFPWISEKSLIE